MTVASLAVLSTLSYTTLAQKSSSSESDLLSLSCLIYDDLSFYDLRGLQNKKQDYSFKSEKTQHKYTFNLCSYTQPHS